MFTVKVHRKVAKKLELKTFPISVKKAIEQLLFDLKGGGAVARNWPNYGKLGGNKHHCHLKKGKTTYVAVWLEDRETQTIEVTYVGTHENAPY